MDYASIESLVRFRLRKPTSTNIVDILLRLSPESFQDIRRHFGGKSILNLHTDDFPTSLSEFDFVKVLKPHVVQYFSADLQDSPLRTALINLFHTIDTSSSGSITFEDLSEYIMSALDRGMTSASDTLTVFARKLGPSSHRPDSLSSPFHIHFPPSKVVHIHRTSFAYLLSSSIAIYSLPFTRTHTIPVASPTAVCSAGKPHTIAVASTWRVYIYDLHTTTILTTFDLPSSVLSLIHVPFIDCLCCGLDDGRIALLLLSSHDVIGTTLPLVSQPAHDAWVTCLACGSSFKGVVSGGEDGKLFVWTLDSITPSCFLNAGSTINLKQRNLRPKLELEGDNSPITAIDMAESLSNLIVVGSRSGLVTFYSPFLSRSCGSVSLGRPIVNVIISPSLSSVLALDQAGRLKVVDIKVLRIVQVLGESSSLVYQSFIQSFDCFRSDKRQTSGTIVVVDREGNSTLLDEERSSGGFGSSMATNSLYASGEEISAAINVVILTATNSVGVVFGSSLFCYDLLDGRFRFSLGGSILKLVNYFSFNGAIYYNFKSTKSITETVSPLSELQSCSFHEQSRKLVLGTSCGILFSFNADNWSPLFYYKLANEPVLDLKFFESNTEKGRQVSLLVYFKCRIVVLNITKPDYPSCITVIRFNSKIVDSELYHVGVKTFLFVSSNDSLFIYELINTLDSSFSSLICKIDFVSVQYLHYCPLLNVVFCLVKEGESGFVHVLCGLSFRIVCVLGLPMTLEDSHVCMETCPVRQIHDDNEEIVSVFLAICNLNNLFIFDLSKLINSIKNFNTSLLTKNSKFQFEFTEHLLCFSFNQLHPLFTTTNREIKVFKIRYVTSTCFPSSISFLKSVPNACSFTVGFSDGTIKLVDALNADGRPLAQLHSPNQSDLIGWHLERSLFIDNPHSPLNVVSDGDQQTRVVFGESLFEISRQIETLLSFFNLEPSLDTSLCRSTSTVSLGSIDSEQTFGSPARNFNLSSLEPCTEFDHSLSSISPYFSSLRKVTSEINTNVSPFYAKNRHSPFKSRMPVSKGKTKRSKSTLLSKFGDLELLEDLCLMDCLDDDFEPRSPMNLQTSPKKETQSLLTPTASEMNISFELNDNLTPLNRSFDRRKSIFSGKGSLIDTSGFSSVDVHQDRMPSFTEMFKVKEDFLSPGEKLRLRSRKGHR
ncbi:hypothetical protein P9112_007484 [Eukaryota sp. TZLM1-RC]